MTASRVEKATSDLRFGEFVLWRYTLPGLTDAELQEVRDFLIAKRMHLVLKDNGGGMLDMLDRRIDYLDEYRKARAHDS